MFTIHYSCAEAGHELVEVEINQLGDAWSPAVVSTDTDDLKVNTRPNAQVTAELVADKQLSLDLMVVIVVFFLI